MLAFKGLKLFSIQQIFRGGASGENHLSSMPSSQNCISSVKSCFGREKVILSLTCLWNTRNIFRTNVSF